MGVGERVEADIADQRRFALADQDRRAVEEQPIDQIGGKEGGGGFGAALDQQIVDAFEPATSSGLAEPFPSLRARSPRVSNARRGERSSSPSSRTSSRGASAS